MNIDLFTELGDVIERQWLDVNYNEERLPEIASAALRDADIPSKTTPWEAVTWALGQKELPQQRDIHGAFGEPPITLYQARRFHIDLYFWFTSTTSMHQHSFCGAFQVFEGSSLHSWYEFEREDTINFFTETGKLTLKTCQILEKGMVQEIWPGRRYIHALYHLDEPSITIVVRTHRSPLELPQFNYFKPGFAVDAHFEQDAETVKKTQLAIAMLRANRPEADDAIAGVLSNCDLQTAFSVLSTLRGHFRGPMDRVFGLEERTGRFGKLLAVVEERHGRAADILRPVFEFRDLQDHYVRQRGVVTQPEHRFFYALLLNLDDREHILEVVRQRFRDEDPVEKILDWVFDLSNVRIMGSENATALGVPDFGEAEMFVLEGLLRGRSDEEIAAEYAAESARAGHNDIPDAVAKIRNSTTFRPLLV